MVPITQSGFRKGFRTTDNLVILRTLHERALTSKKPLYVAFIDLEKAFDNVDRMGLWRLIHQRGGKGLLIDSLRALYQNTTTSLRLKGRYSDLFNVDKGVLQGDPLSPILFIIYIGGLDVRHADDVMLDGLPIPEALLADDIMLPSSSAEGLQFKLDALTAYFDRLGMKVNPNKSKILRLGCVMNDIPPSVFETSGVILEEVLHYKYVGYTVTGGKSARWQTNAFVEKCIQKCRRVATSLLQLRKHIGPSNADFMMRLWHNLADPYFVFGAEVSFDCSTVQDNLMDQVLLQYVRSAMGLPPKSIRILPLLDNAIFEVRHRRLELTSRFVEYAWLCKDDRPVRKALMDSMAISPAFPHAWYSQFSARVAALGVDPEPRRGLARDVRGAIIKQMTTEWNLLRACSRMSIHRISPLVNQFEWHRKKLPYLRILSFAACRAIVKVRMSAHNLMVERGRHSRVPRFQRMCPACLSQRGRSIVETEHHAFNCCPDHDVARNRLWQELFAIDSRLAGCTEKELLGVMLNPKKDFAAIVGRFFRAVLDKVDLRYLVNENEMGRGEVG